MILFKLSSVLLQRLGLLKIRQVYSRGLLRPAEEAY